MDDTYVWALIATLAAAFASMIALTWSLLATIRGEIAGLRTDMLSEVAGLRTDMLSEVAGLRDDVGDLRVDVAKLDKDITHTNEALLRHIGEGHH